MTIFHASEARAFWDYYSNLGLKLTNINEMEPLFNDWAKDFSAEDKATIWRIVKEHIQREAEGKSRKRKVRRHKNKTSEAVTLPRQIEFDFLK